MIELNKFSYSSISTFKQCPLKFKLTYIDNHYFDIPSIATDFGSLIHKIEELIGKSIKSNQKIDYDFLLKLFDSKIEEIKEKYYDDFYKIDKENSSYEIRANYYKNVGIYRLERRIKEQKLQIIGLEKEFILDYNTKNKNYHLHGFIDRILFDGNNYIIEDIKTYKKELNEKELINPLQLIIYKIAFDKDNVICNYDLPFCNVIQKSSTPKTTKECLSYLKSVLESIEGSDFKPNPSPLCYWCPFSNTFPNQPDKAKKLCEDYSRWKPKSLNK